MMARFSAGTTGFEEVRYPGSPFQTTLHSATRDLPIKANFTLEIVFALVILLGLLCRDDGWNLAARREREREWRFLPY